MFEGGGPRKIVTEMHVQMRAGSDCNYSCMVPYDVSFDLNNCHFRC